MQLLANRTENLNFFSSHYYVNFESSKEFRTLKDWEMKAVSIRNWDGVCLVAI